MANLLCPACATRSDEFVVTCLSCGAEVVDLSSMTEPNQLVEEEQVVYELVSWTLDQRTEVALVMAESGVPHAWEGEELIVHLVFEDLVDRLLEPIEFGGEAPPLDQSPGEPIEPLTEYDLADWSAGARQAVSEQLAAAGIAFRWEDGMLLVNVDDEDPVDDLLDELEESGALDDADDRQEDDPSTEIDEGAETPGEVLEKLFLASDRLRRKARDADGLSDLAAAMALVNPARPPYGLDPLAWRRITALAEELVEAETEDDEYDDEDQRDEDARERAGQFRDLVRPYV